MSASGTIKIGEAIKTQRASLGMSQKDLAAQAETTEAAISHIERGMRKPSAEMLARLASALGCSVDHLLAGVVPASKQSPYMQRVLHAMQSMPPRVQEQVADYCDFLRQKKRSKRS